MAYLSSLPHLPGQQQASMAISQNEIDREQRNKAVQKFLARAEISMVREFRSHQTRPPRGDTSGLHGMPIPPSIRSSLPDVVNVFLIAKSEIISPPLTSTDYSHRLPVPYERVFLMLRIRLLITFRTSLCVISRRSLRTRVKRPPSAVQLPPSARLLEPITITTTRLHRVKAQVVIGKAVRAQCLLQNLAPPLGHIIHPFMALQVTPMGPQFQISTHPFLHLLRPNMQGQSITQTIHLFLLQCALLHRNHASRSRRPYKMAIIYNLKADIQIKRLRRLFLPTDEKTNELLSTKENKNGNLVTWTSMVISI
jgi:hypothetical protein